MNDLKDWIKKYETYKSHPYMMRSGKVIVGHGRRIDDNGISKEEADFMFDNDFAQCQKELSYYPWYVNQPKNVQFALMNMCFNLGIESLLSFTKMIKALTIKDYTAASMEVLDSQWAIRIGERAKDVALMIRQG